MGEVNASAAIAALRDRSHRMLSTAMQAIYGDDSKPKGSGELDEQANYTTRGSSDGPMNIEPTRQTVHDDEPDANLTAPSRPK